MSLNCHICDKYNLATPLPLENESGAIATDGNEQLVVWKRYFESILNILHDEDNNHFTSLRRRNPHRSMDSRPPSKHEIREAILSLKPGYATAYR